MKFSRLKITAFLFALLITLVTVSKARSLGSPDFKVFYTAARWGKENPLEMYHKSPDRYLYPPSTAILLRPFAFSPNYKMHQWFWHGMLGVIVFYLAGLSWGAFFALVLLSRYLMISLAYGQINLVVILLLWVTGKSLLQRASFSGALWSLATSIKVYPVIFFPAFLYRKNFRAVLAAAVAGLLLLALPFLFWESTIAIQLYHDFFGALQRKGTPLHSHNQSIVALLLRLFTDQSFYLHAVDFTKWTLLALPEFWVRGAALCLGLGMSLYSWRVAYRRGYADFLSAMAFSLLFLSHIVWKDYLLFLYFPLSLIWQRLKGKPRAWLAGGFLFLVTLSSMDIVGAPIATRLDAACIHLWGAILVWWAWCKYEDPSERINHREK